MAIYIRGLDRFTAIMTHDSIKIEGESGMSISGHCLQFALAGTDLEGSILLLGAKCRDALSLFSKNFGGVFGRFDTSNMIFHNLEHVSHGQYSLYG